MAKLVPSLSSEQIVLSGDIAVGIGFPLNVGTPKQNFTTTQQIHDNLRNLIMTQLQLFTFLEKKMQVGYRVVLKKVVEKLIIKILKKTKKI